MSIETSPADASEARDGAPSSAARDEAIARLACVLVALAITVTYTVMAFSFHKLARYAPLAAGMAATLLLIVALIKTALPLVSRRFKRASNGKISRGIEYDESMPSVDLTINNIGKAGIIILSFIAYILGVIFINIYASTFVFMVFSLKYYAKASWIGGIVSALGICGYLWVFTTTQSLQWP